MKAKSAGLKITKAKKTKDGIRTRLPRAERREMILNQAADFFSEYGLTGQTRSLAAACGISQRLLYRFFPNKAAITAEVYARTILGPFKGTWLAHLRDRERPVIERLTEFYKDYSETVLTRRWLRLFLYSSLAEGDMAPNYIASIVTQLLDTIVEEVAADQGVKLPDDQFLRHELGWTLHGTISHMAIRKHLYHASQSVPTNEIIAFHVCSFVAGFKAMVEAASPSQTDT
ncbi:MAG: TetR/AcrR family transcriptional regulator [Rhodospirillales bacterium]|nr:TetR/AcrR family transcriptional regulator [Rhodospirillales bacterium]